MNNLIIVVVTVLSFFYTSTSLGTIKRLADNGIRFKGLKLKLLAFLTLPGLIIGLYILVGLKTTSKSFSYALKIIYNSIARYPLHVSMVAAQIEMTVTQNKSTLAKQSIREKKIRRNSDIRLEPVYINPYDIRENRFLFGSFIKYIYKAKKEEATI
jgi:hypothetical protein